MNSISQELITYIIREEVQSAIIGIEDEIPNKINLLSLEILEEIKSVLSQHYKLTDFGIVEKIVCILEKYNIDCGACHDFG